MHNANDIIGHWTFQTQLSTTNFVQEIITRIEPKRSAEAILYCQAERISKELVWNHHHHHWLFHRSQNLHRISVRTTMHTQEDHYFSFSALDYFWENTHQMAVQAVNSFSSPPSPPRKIASSSKPPRSPTRGRSFEGRPPLSPVSISTNAWDYESVETVLSPRSSMDDVRLFVVRELEDIPDLYHEFNHHHGGMSDANSLDLTQESNPSADDVPCNAEVCSASSSSATSEEEEELLGLSLLCLEAPSESTPTSLVRLDLDFLKQDPPKAHLMRQCAYY